MCVPKFPFPTTVDSHRVYYDAPHVSSTHPSWQKKNSFVGNSSYDGFPMATFLQSKSSPDFMPMGRLKNWMARTVAVTSGSIDVFTSQTKFEETDPTRLIELEARAKVRTVKFGQVDLMSMFETKKKKEEPKISTLHSNQKM
jgi:hypothetical protein